MVFRCTIVARAALLMAAAAALFGLSAGPAWAQGSQQFPSETYDPQQFPSETYSGKAQFPDDQWEEKGVGIDPGRGDKRGVGINPGRSEKRGVGINPGRFDQ